MICLQKKWYKIHYPFLTNLRNSHFLILGKKQRGGRRTGLLNDVLFHGKSQLPLNLLAVQGTPPNLLVEIHLVILFHLLVAKWVLTQDSQFLPNII